MLEQGERGSPETFQAICLHDEIREAFRKSDPVILSSKRTLALLSGTVQVKGEIESDNLVIYVTNVIRNDEDAYTILVRDLTNPEAGLMGAVAFPSRVTDMTETRTVTDVELILDLRYLIEMAVFDNMTATREALNIERLRAQGKNALGEYLHEQEISDEYLE